MARQVSVRQRPICGRSSERAAGQLQLLTSSAAMRELKVVIFMVRRFVFMHPAVHPATHAPGHPSIRAYVHSTIHAVSQGCDNARFNKELAKVGHIPGVSGTSVKEITQTLTGIV